MDTIQMKKKKNLFSKHLSSKQCKQIATDPREDETQRCYKEQPWPLS